MLRPPFVRAVLVVLLATLVVPATVLAQAGSLYVEPKTNEARSVMTLFNITLVIAVIVFVFVEGLLFVVIWRARKIRREHVEVAHRGHVTAEVVWTIIPALVLLGLGVASAGTLFNLDTVPTQTDVTVKVTAHQFVWTYDYSENAGYDRNVTKSASNTLYVETGKVVKLDIRSVDVIHSFFVPEFSLKLDAFPDRTNHQWFTAPAPGEYFMQCTEYCGVGHHLMQGKIVVFPAGQQPVPYGLYTPPPPPSNTTNSTG